MCEPLVSVLLPVHNGARFLRQSIQSILDQSYSNYELIVVDDGSKDDTSAIVASYGSRLNHIHQKENQGVSVALNLAMQEAKGEYIFFQTSDDLSHGDRIQSQLKILDGDTRSVAACLPAFIDVDGKPKISGDLPTFARVHGRFGAEDWLRLLFFNGNFVCAPSVAFHRSVWSSVGGANASLLQMQDFEYWFRASILGISLHVVETPLISFRWHGDNLSSPANDARTRREMALIYRKATDLMDLAHVRNLFEVAADKIAAYRQFSDIETIPKTILLPLLLVRHRLSWVRQIGYEGLLCMLEDERAVALVKLHTGMNRRAIMDLLLQGT